MSLTKETVMLLFIPDHKCFQPHLISMLLSTQDDGFGEGFEAPLDTYLQSLAFAEQEIDFSENIYYLRH